MSVPKYTIDDLSKPAKRLYELTLKSDIDEILDNGLNYTYNALLGLAMNPHLDGDQIHIFFNLLERYNANDTLKGKTNVSSARSDIKYYLSINKNLKIDDAKRIIDGMKIGNPTLLKSPHLSEEIKDYYLKTKVIINNSSMKVDYMTFARLAESPSTTIQDLDRWFDILYPYLDFITFAGQSIWRTFLEHRFASKKIFNTYFDADPKCKFIKLDHTGRLWDTMTLTMMLRNVHFDDELRNRLYQISKNIEHLPYTMKEMFLF